jgi:hypothetical protein
MTFEEIANAIQSALRPGNFFVAEPLHLRIEHHPQEVCRWEVFRGHLLDPAQTRLEKTFASWNLILDPPGRSIISIRFDAEQQKVHVVRFVEVYGWEAYEDAGVIQSREARKWNGELIGTIDLAELPGETRLAWALHRLLFFAVVGTSRLPITSIESPLPVYSLGQFAHIRQTTRTRSESAVTHPQTLLKDLCLESAFAAEGRLRWIVKAVDFALRASPASGIPAIADQLFAKWQDPANWGLITPEQLFILIFNHAALSPYTAFVDNLTALLLRLAEPSKLGADRVLDIFSYMLRHLVRHLTSYNLTEFHNLGANYPDALALDALLRAYIELLPAVSAEPTDHLPRGKLRRRALRQAWMLRKQLEGLRVPAMPTSPGENLRVMPAPFERIPQDELLQPAKRSKRLFEGQPAESLLTAAARDVLRESLDQLFDPSELRELGLGVYLDRPLGVFKERGEVDRTPLLSYEAFSRTIARNRLTSLRDWGVLPPEQHRECHESLDVLSVPGIPVGELPDRERPAVVSLEEAKRAAEDFVFCRSTASSLHQFAWLLVEDNERHHAADPMLWLRVMHHALVIRTPRQFLHGSPPPLMTAFDEHMQRKADLFLVQNDGQPIRYREWLSVELPELGLRYVPCD